MKELKFSLFYDPKNGIKNSTPHKEIDLPKLIAIYQSDFIKGITTRMQSEKDLQIQKDMKNKLPSFTPYGTFYPTRSNKTMIYHNQHVIAFDVDEIGNSNAITLRNKLSSKDGCIMCTISPRKSGVKALFLIKDITPHENKKKFLDANIDALCSALDISQYIDNVDSSQFKESQTFFIAFDPGGYFNPDPVPLEINLITPEKIIHESIKIKSQILVDGSKKRIEIYLKNKTEKMINYMKNLSKGNRHDNMWKVLKIKSDLHYLPEMESEIKRAFETMIHQMYHDEIDRIEPEKSWMERAWNYAIDKENPTINQIIEDEKAKIRLIDLIKKIKKTDNLLKIENTINKAIEDEK